MSIHKLTAGSGYDYLTRQVAVFDATDKGHVGLSSYYTERGETPGVWVGSGLVGVEGLNAGDVVTADQMQALFGSGHHPLAEQRRTVWEERLAAAGPGERAVLLAADPSRLGAPFKVYDHDVSPFRAEVARRFAAFNTDAGLPSDWPVPAGERARIRTRVGTEFFRAAHGRDPVDARELSGAIAELSRPKTTAVAGYDLTFRPVKSASVLWALGDPGVAASVERAHNAAVADALRFLETNALFTRMGANGVRQVEVTGLLGTAFTHRDSRNGDPLLHTHVAVANKVQVATPEGTGTWLSVDGRVLFKATVAASETYNTAFERHLTAALGVRFAERPEDPRRAPTPGERGKQKVREIVGIPQQLVTAMSSRRRDIEARQGVLSIGFQREHGRVPTAVEALALAQQATLETRAPKHAHRRLVDQRAAWRMHAAYVLGGDPAVDAMVHAALSPSPRRSTDQVVTSQWLAQTADRIVAALEARRSTWQQWHVHAEAMRQVRPVDLPAKTSEEVVDLLVRTVLGEESVCLTPPDPVDTGVGLVPEPLRRSDGSSVYTLAGAGEYTSARILAAEQALVAAADVRHGHADGRRVPDAVVEIALLEQAANRVDLDPDQQALVRAMATSGARLQLAIAPAGSGKTTALRTLADAWNQAGGNVIALAPSAAAAALLAENIEGPARPGGTRGGLLAHHDTLAKLTWSLDQAGQPQRFVEIPEWLHRVDAGSLVLIDEAAMADTLSLHTAVRYIVGQGGSVRLVGDDQQLSAIGAGGVLRDIATTHGALRLHRLHRFSDPAEAAATLGLREGDPQALGFYLDHHRVHVGDLATITHDAFAAWASDQAAGLDSLMLAPTRELVADLNHRARQHRLTSTGQDHQSTPSVGLADGNHASRGDLVLTRSNNRRLHTRGAGYRGSSAGGWVKNGDRWRVLALEPDGALRVQHTKSQRTVRLPAEYVRAWTELGYASTIHAAQGITADTVHGVLTGTESRQQLYTLLTRGRDANHAYLQVAGDGDPHDLIRPETIHPRTATDILTAILARDDAPVSATSQLRAADNPAQLLGDAAARYLDALHVATEDRTGPRALAEIEATARHLAPGLTDEPAWPTLRTRLVTAAAAGEDPLAHLVAAAVAAPLGTAHDTAAVLTWRLDNNPSTRREADEPGPLPWLPAIPAALADDPRWGEYLAQRGHLVTSLAQQVHDACLHETVETSRPRVWAPFKNAHAYYDTELIADLDIWRAATGVSPHDPTPTGPPQPAAGPATWQQHLNDRCREADVNLRDDARRWEQHASARKPRTRPPAYDSPPARRRGVDR